jgi:hypothetical protein
MLNLTALFYTSDEGEQALLDKLELRPERRAFIARAKTDVRACLKTGIPGVLRSQGYTAGVPEPRFFTQGSWAYKTLNAPAQQTQQADIDDGAYLPLSFVAQTARPSVASAVYFAATQAALAPLVKARNWKLISDKPTCVRIEIAHDAHIDIPLYAIPDHEFMNLAKAAALHGYLNFTEALAKAERDAWTKLPKNSVLLAHREKNWMVSDPRPVKDWFLAEVDAKGEQLRRVVRYLKAFRDWQWSAGGPSSILLMAAAAPVFERRDRRDDLALLDVAAALPDVLRDGVNNPIDATESLTKRVGPEAVEEMAKRYEQLERILRACIDARNEAQACTWMVQQFGPRFPEAPHRVKVASVAATIASTPAVAGASELVGRTKAG